MENRFNSNSIEIILKRTYSNNPPEVHKFQFLLCTDNRISFRSLYDVSKAVTIDKVGMAFDNDKNQVYIALHNIANQANNCSIYLITPNADRSSWGIYEGFTLVKTPNLETMLNITHTFKANSWLDGPDAWPLT